MNVTQVKAKWEESSIFRYLVVGAWNTFFSIVLLYSLFFIFSTKYYEYELGFTFLIATCQSFFTQRKFVWMSSDVVKAELLRFYAGTTLQYLLNSISLYGINREFHIDPANASLPVLLFITCCFYFVNKHLVFK